MSLGKREAERHFQVSLRSRPLETVVETDYTRLVDARKVQSHRAEMLKCLACWLLSLLVCAVAVAL